MGKYKQGIMGPFTGNVGTVNGTSWKGIPVMRSTRKRRTASSISDRQRAHHAKFKLVNAFISPLASLVELTFNSLGVGKSSINLAFQYCFQNAIIGTFPDFSLDYKMILISKGDLIQPKNPQVDPLGAGLIKFTWDDNSGIAQANETDHCIMFVHCKELSQSLWKIDGAARNLGTDQIDAGIFIGKPVQCWIAFISDDKKEVSTSIYVGDLIL